MLALLKDEEYFESVRRSRSVAASLAARADLTPAEAAALARYEASGGRLTALGSELGALTAKKIRTEDEERRLRQLKEDVAVASRAFGVVLRQIADDLGKRPAARDLVKELEATRGLRGDLKAWGEGVVALSTVLTEERYWVILTTHTVQVSGQSAVGAKALGEKILRFREALQDPQRDPRPLGQELYRLLLGPVENELQGAGAKVLVWSLDGVLRYVPVAALHDGQGYLAERYASVLMTLSSRTRLSLEASGPWKGLGVGVSKAHEGFAALEAVPAELRAVVREQERSEGVVPGRVLLDEAFTRDALERALAARYALVHVASHFAFQPASVRESFLLLGDGGRLTLDDMLSAGLPYFDGVDLVTLSACDTALGSGDGREVESFGVEAQNMGAKAVVATLWPVADESTRDLMTAFYRWRQENPQAGKAEALRQAQLGLLHGRAAREGPQVPQGAVFVSDPQKPYAHPYYWAPFILIGNWK